MKNKQTRGDLESIRSSILRVTDVLTEILDRMKGTGVSQVLIHTKDAENKHIPALWKWALKARSEAELQLELGRSDSSSRGRSPKKGRKAAGRKTSARGAAPRKRAAPKKPPKKSARRAPRR